MKTKLVFEFDNEAAARHFGTWLCEAGEQDYWVWMEYREQEENGPITVQHFDYHNTKEVDGKKKCGQFLEDLTIRCQCGRLGK